MRILILATLLLTACSERIDPAPAAGEFHALAVEWRIVDRDALEATYRAAGMELGDRQSLRGFAGTLPDGRAVVYTLPPQRVDDDATCTLGHEVMHVALGSYHK